MEWKPIETHRNIYEVSDSGEVRRFDGYVLKQWKNNGYPSVRLSNPRVICRVHRLVAMAFIPNPKNKPNVNHIDCNTANNSVGNLEWCTQWENLKHSEKLGRMNRQYWKGKRSPNAHIPDAIAESIRMDYKNGGISWEKLGNVYGVSKRTVGRIVKGETYV